MQIVASAAGTFQLTYGIILRFSWSMTWGDGQADLLERMQKSVLF
jgi:hypothetical protein